MDRATQQMIRNRDELRTTTAQTKANALANNTVHSACMVNLIITFFETEDHNNNEILALLTNELDIEYADASMWKPSADTPLDRIKVLAAATQMDDLLWMYLQNIIFNIDGMNCAIYMMPADQTYETNLFYRGELTRKGRAKFTVPDFHTVWKHSCAPKTSACASARR